MELEGHPRNAGTYSRVLAQYVREKGTVTLMDAIRKMSFMPAEMLERSTPAARRKGRLQEGATRTLWCLMQRLSATALLSRSLWSRVWACDIWWWEEPLVVDEGKIVPDVFPGARAFGAGMGKAVDR